MQSELIAENIWKLHKGAGLSSNAYLVCISENTLIDLGSEANSEALIRELSKLGIRSGDIKNVIFTHFHFDHVGSPYAFKNARFFASEEEISILKKRRQLLDSVTRHALQAIKLEQISKRFNEFSVIKTPGHTSGSICLYLPLQGILFSGDTLFPDGPGRTDLPTSSPEDLASSLEKLKTCGYRILCPGH